MQSSVYKLKTPSTLLHVAYQEPISWRMFRVFPAPVKRLDRLFVCIENRAPETPD